MRKTTYLSRAVSVGILVFAAMLLLLLYPFRKFRREVILPRDDFPVAESLTVNDDTQVIQRFQTEFDQVKAIEVFVESLDGGRYMQVHVNDIYGPERAYRVIDLAKETIPGYVRIPMGMKIPKGNPEMIVLDAEYSSFRLQTEDVSALPAEWHTFLYAAGEQREAAHLRMRVVYDFPVTGKTTVLAGGVIALCALLLTACVHLFFRRFPGKNRLVVVRDVWKRALQALTALFFVTIFLMNFPFRRFDPYAGETLFYGVGILLAAAVAFYVIHRLFGDLSVTIRPEWRLWAMSAFFALALEYAVEHANAFYDIYHFIAMRQLAICLFALLIAAVFPKYLLHPAGIVYALAAAGTVLWYVHREVTAAAEPLDELNLQLTRLKGIMFAVLGYVLLLLLLHLLEVLRKHRAQEAPRLFADTLKRVSPYGWFTALTALVMLLFANGRLWIFNLVLLWILFYIGICTFGVREQWYKIFSEGVMMHFLASVLFCLLHRSYQFWVFFRYPFVFTTVTVAGEYLVLVLAVAAVRLVQKLRELPAGTSVKECFRHAPLEFFFFGTVSGYLALTITRLAWVSAAGMLFVVLLLAGRRNRLRSAVMMLLATLLLFAPVFSMQRIVPSLLSDHRFVGGWEEMVTYGGVMGDIPTDSPFYMRFGRYVDLIGLRLTGAGGEYRMRKETPLNYDSAGNLLYARNGIPASEAPAPKKTGAGTPAGTATEPAGNGADITGLGGRRAVWEAYLGELNMRGHEGEEIEGIQSGHAHNTYLQAMYDHGVPAGLLFSAWIGITILTGALRYRKKRDAAAYLQTAMTTGFAFVGMAEWIFHPGNPVTVMLLGLITPLMTKESERA